MFDDDGYKYIQSYILNLSFPKSLRELKEVFIDERGEYDVETILHEDEYDWTSWTAPRWAKVGDIVFFMHAKNAHAKISALRTELTKRKDEFDDASYQELSDWLARARDLHRKYGGKIFAVAHVSMSPEYQRDDRTFLHWKSRVFAEVQDFWLLDEPIDITEFREFILISRQSSITPLYGDAFDKLKEVIKRRNHDAPEYFDIAVSAPVPLSKMDKNNWLEVSYSYRRRFILEQQFRTFYVDYFLKELGDRKTIYSECKCQKEGMADSYVDNIILFNGKYLMVEVKLNIQSERNLIKQISKYCDDDNVYLSSKEERPLNKEMIYNGYVLVIDTENVYLYNNNESELAHLISLDDVRQLSDIAELRERMMMFL